MLDNITQIYAMSHGFVYYSIICVIVRQHTKNGVMSIRHPTQLDNTQIYVTSHKSVMLFGLFNQSFSGFYIEKPSGREVVGTLGDDLFKMVIEFGKTKPYRKNASFQTFR